jgi:hypothetical protein
MKAGDRVRLSGGYHMEPQWLQGGNGYLATVLGFLENEIEGRHTDGQLSALIEFDQALEFESLIGKYGLLDLRYVDQTWERSGPTHVYLLTKPISSIVEKTSESSRWMESHAFYEIVEVPQ